jgi:hypothetical protein
MPKRRPKALPSSLGTEEDSTLGDFDEANVPDWERAQVSLNAYGFQKIAEKIEAERAAWRKALGVPQGLEIPDDPIPPTAEACRAEIERVRKLEIAALDLRYALPPGQEYESAGAAMVYWRGRRWSLECAIRDWDVHPNGKYSPHKHARCLTDEEIVALPPPKAYPFLED